MPNLAVSSELSTAIHAFNVAGIPRLGPALPGQLSEPLELDFLGGTEQPVNDAFWSSPIVEATLASGHGREAERIGRVISGRLVTGAAKRGARLAVSTLRVNGSKSFQGLTTYALWDNAEEHITEGDLHEGLGINSESTPYGALESTSLRNAVLASVARTIIDVFSGELVVMNGEDRLKVSRQGSDQPITVCSGSKTDGIEGNLVVAQVPHGLPAYGGGHNRLMPDWLTPIQ